MDAQEIIRFIADAKKVTPVKIYLREKSHIDFSATNAKIFGAGDKIIFGDWSELKPILDANADSIADIVIENSSRNSAIPLLDMKDIPARIEPGAIIRDNVSIGRNAVIMMGAVLNIGAVVGEGTMIDMNAVLGGRATVGKNCHIGAGAVLAGVIEPA
ncbi:MAG: 2,3,4,5-tetrahydropyridine-2,6-dicarboxylate N-acetyltransferase, partial [Synergistaceae bacterium]|nr:2,3,4,5-tetrahydropyridine-2,6-dicarboxylate N-acetyltransferase [Synergistaceae bacterium]